MPWTVWPGSAGAGSPCSKYEDDFAEDDTLPTFIPPEKLNKFIFNANTVDTVLQNLMERGSKEDYAGNSRIRPPQKQHLLHESSQPLYRKRT